MNPTINPTADSRMQNKQRQFFIWLCVISVDLPEALINWIKLKIIKSHINNWCTAWNDDFKRVV